MKITEPQQFFLFTLLSLNEIIKLLRKYLHRVLTELNTQEAVYYVQ